MKNKQKILANITKKTISKLLNAYGFITPCLYETTFSKTCKDEGVILDKYKIEEELNQIIEKQAQEAKANEENMVQIKKLTSGALESMKNKDMSLLEEYANQTDELLQKILKMEEEMIKDELTGVLNRKGLLAKTTKNGKMIFDGIMFVFDIDKFKLINDTYGHPIADKILQAFVQKLLQKVVINIPKNEYFISRIGGDEFVLVCKATNASYARMQLKNLQKEGLKFLIAEKQVPVHFSFGAFLFANASDFTDVYCDADKAMYQDKKNKQKLTVPHKIDKAS